MAGRRRTNPNKPRAGIERHEFQADAPLGREAGAVLAVLVLASYWPGRFGDRWVTAEDFGNHSRDLPKSREGDVKRRETARALIRRGLSELRSLLPDDAIERKSVGAVAPTKDPRERATRLRYSPTAELEGWFTRFGLERLDPGTRKAFREHAYGALGTVGEFKSALEEGVIYRLLAHGMQASHKEAAARASTALANAATPHDRRVFAFALAQAELHDWEGGRLRALAILRELAAHPGPYRSPSEYLLQGRILIELAGALPSRPQGEDESDLTEVRQYLSRARDLIPMDCYLERGELAMAEARLEGIESHRCSQNGGAPEDAMRHRDNAELSVLAAVNAWRLVRRWDLVRAGIVRLRHMPGELKEPTVDVERARILIPWLHALVQYQDAETPPPSHGRRAEPNPFGVHELHKEILEAFNSLPQDIASEALPIPAEEAYSLLKRCIVAYRNDEFYDTPANVLEPEESILPVEHAAWFIALQEQEKSRRGY